MTTSDTYYHVSNAVYRFPSLEVIENNARFGTESAVKVLLGYYVSPTPWTSYGKHTYEIKVKPSTRIWKWPLAEMVDHYNFITHYDRNHNTRCDMYIEYRQQQCKLYDMIHIVECNNMVGECVIMNLDTISSFTQIR